MSSVMHRLGRILVAVLAAVIVLVQASSLQDMEDHIVRNIVDLVGDDFKAVARFSRSCRIGRRLTKPALKVHRIFYYKTPIHQVPDLIQKLAHDIETGDLESKRSAENIIKFKDVVRLFKRMIESCHDQQVIGYNEELHDPFLATPTSLSGNQVLNSFRNLKNFVNESLITDAASIFLSPDGFLQQLPDLTLPDPHHDLPRVILYAVMDVNYNMSRDIFYQYPPPPRQYNTDLINKIRKRYQAPFNEIFPKNRQAASVILSQASHNARVFTELGKVSVLRALLRFGIQFPLNEFVRYVKVDTKSMIEILPLLDLTFSDISDLEQLLEGSDIDSIVRLLKTPECQELINAHPDAFDRVLMMSKDSTLIKASLQEDDKDDVKDDIGMMFNSGPDMAGCSRKIRFGSNRPLFPKNISRHSRQRSYYDDPNARHWAFIYSGPS